MNNKYIEITIGNITCLIFAIIVCYIFCTGWECGFSGKCDGFDLNDPFYGDKWQGVFRELICGVGSIVLLGMAFHNWHKKIKIPIPKITIKKEEDSEAWVEYQQWLKERNKDGNNK